MNPKWSDSTIDDAHKRNEINKIEPAFGRFCAAHARVSRQFNQRLMGNYSGVTLFFLSFFVSSRGEFFQVSFGYLKRV